MKIQTQRNFLLVMTILFGGLFVLKSNFTPEVQASKATIEDSMRPTSAKGVGWLVVMQTHPKTGRVELIPYTDVLLMLRSDGLVGWVNVDMSTTTTLYRGQPTK